MKRLETYHSGDAGLSGNKSSAAKIHSVLFASQIQKAFETDGCEFAAEEQMGPVLLPGMNSVDLRIFHYEQPFYNIVKQRRLRFCFGQRPDDMLDIPTINQRIWEKHQTYLKRLENFPLKKAQYYQNLQESKGAKSVRALSEITGEDWSHIARVLKTLELPESIQKFLNENREPEIVKHFHLRRLLEIVRLGDESSQLAKFRELFDESALNLSPGVGSSPPPT